MSLRDKAAGINFDDLDEESQHQSVDAAMPAASSQMVPRPSRTTGVAGITDRINLHHQVQELQAEVAKYADAQLVVKLDPKRVRQSRWKNRHELSYSTQDFQDLKAEIETAGGNVQPIKVRPAGKGADDEDEYEIVYGRRRLRACDELGFLVNAIVENLDDLAQFKEMERENRSRADLTPWEQGVMYKDALDKCLFTSQRQMAAALVVSASSLSTAIALASLPQEVLDAFPSPLDLQYRWAAPITEALEANTAQVITLARQLALLEPKLSAKEAFLRLTGEPAVGGASEKEDLVVAGERVGAVIRGRSGLQIRLKGGVISAAKEKKLLDFVRQLLD